MISISIACGLVICLFQFDVGEATVRIDHTTESPLSNANSNRGRLGAAKKNVMDYLRIHTVVESTLP